jgi:lipopolysaccharide transport system ATP-binding protein
MRFLRDFQRRGTLLVVSHDTSAVTNLCDRAIWLDGGRQIMDGITRDVVESYLAAQHAADRSSVGHQVVIQPPKSMVDEAASVAALPSAADGTLLTHAAADRRHAVLHADGTRNRIEVFEFDPEEAGREYGAGDARIVDVRIVGQDGADSQLILGGETVRLILEAEVFSAVEAPIFGFYVKDRLGQRLFGDNTYLFYRDELIKANEGQRLRAIFKFSMPVLPTGEYSIDVALATGSQDDHTQQHWIHDALSFRASESTMRHGLVGIPMQSVELQRLEG